MPAWSSLLLLSLPHGLHSSYSELLQIELLRSELGLDVLAERQAPVAIGVRVGESTLQTLIPYNQGLPAKLTNTLEATCNSHDDELLFPLYASPSIPNRVLHKLVIPCKAGGPGIARIEQTVEMDGEGTLWFSLNDATGRYMHRQMREPVTTYEELLHIIKRLHSGQEKDADRLALTQLKELKERLSKGETELQSMSQRLNSCLAQQEMQTPDAKLASNEAVAGQMRQEIEPSAEKELRNELREGGSATYWLASVTVAFALPWVLMACWRRRGTPALDPPDLGAVSANCGHCHCQEYGSERLCNEQVSANPEAKLNSPERKPCQEADQPFSHRIEAELRGGRRTQRVIIQCPGVCESDINIKVLFNGAEVRIAQSGQSGQSGPDGLLAEWVHRFVIPADEGLFAFVDAQTRWHRGSLQLFFQEQDFVPRTFRFPEHFDMASDSGDENEIEAY